MNIQTLELRFREKSQPGFDRFNENYFTWVREKGDSPDYYHLSYLRIYHETTMTGPHAGALPQIGRTTVPVDLLFVVNCGPLGISDTEQCAAVRYLC